MKSRLTLIFAALVILLGAMVWVVQDRSTAASLMAATPAAPAEPVQPAPAAEPAVSATPVPASIAPPAPAVVPVAPPAPAVPQAESAPTVRINRLGHATYVARDGDTVSQLAIALLGSDSKDHRDAVIAANPSLQADPDRVLTGQPYSIASSAAPAAVDADDQQRDAAPAVASAVVASSSEAARTLHPTPEVNAKAAAVVAPGPKLKYTAQPGDTVRVLASDLLGGDTKQNRDAIIAGNPSLQKDPDHLVAGKNYTIVAPNGLAADPNAPQAKAPTTQPEADEVARLSVGRALRYTAKAGDTVSSLATALLGSDTPANRELIIKSNPSLKQDPDQLTAGQTYWIAAPTAD
ncbi:MAG: LysM peptidoglycan-binding domain-containing protein [Acidobacteria bacterium]|nr:LysM peptidoglycan-binding domain-containing protein [Acidobacteriota bacterium]